MWSRINTMNIHTDIKSHSSILKGSMQIKMGISIPLYIVYGISQAYIYIG